MNQTDAKIRLVSTDFDGTIHEDFVRPGIPVALQRKISALQMSGVTWVINTGRDQRSLMESLEYADIAIRPDYVVAVEREIYRRDLDGSYQAVDPWNSTCRADHAKLFTTLSPIAEKLRRGLAARHDAVIYEDPHSPICVVAKDVPQMDTIEEELRVELSSEPALELVRNSIYLRLSHRAYSKGTALAEIQRIVGVAPTHTLVAGDHLNDLPMMDRAYAHYLVSPKNSVPPVRQRVREQGGYLATRSSGLGILEGLMALGV